MGLKKLHIVFVLVLALAIPLGNIAAPVFIKAPEKAKEVSAEKKTEEQGKDLLQPQVVGAQGTQLSLPHSCLPDGVLYAVPVFVVQLLSPANTLFSEQGTTRFFKVLFRHFVAPQAP